MACLTVLLNRVGASHSAYGKRYWRRSDFINRDYYVVITGFDVGYNEADLIDTNEPWRKRRRLDLSRHSADSHRWHGNALEHRCWRCPCPSANREIRSSQAE